MKIEDDYPLIPMNEITDEAKKLSVAWMECEDRSWIGQKHKLASDIMNYARRFHQSQTDDEIKEYKKKLGIANKALIDIKNWDDLLEEFWGDPGDRASSAIKLIDKVSEGKTKES